MTRRDTGVRPSPGRIVSFQRGDGVRTVNPPPQDDQKITLMMLSGGFDSVYYLYKILLETDDYVVAHHVNLINAEGRHREEQAACHAIVTWLRENVRWIEYGETSIDHTSLPVFGYDMISIGFEVGVVSHSIYGVHGRMPDRWLVGSCTEEGGNPERWRHVEKCVAANCYPEEPPEFDYDMPVVTKAEELAYLPKALRDLVWYCRRPVRTDGTSKPCGKCPTCDVVATAYATLDDQVDVTDTGAA